MNKRVIVLLSLLAASVAQAQVLSVTSAKRSIRGFAFGFDHDFNNGQEVTDQTLAPAGEWISEVAADLHDYYGYAVGKGQAYEESQIGPQALSFTVDVMATTAGNHFQADSSGRGEYSVSFSLAEKVRFVARAHADVTSGYNLASVRLTSGGVTKVAAVADYGGSQSVEETGWLDAGSYQLSGEAEAQAYGTSGQPDLQFGNVECDFQIYHAADYDLDGDVDSTDIKQFGNDFLAGATSADFDGDGDTDQADFKAFRITWIQAQG